MIGLAPAHLLKQPPVRSQRMLEAQWLGGRHAGRWISGLASFWISLVPSRRATSFFEEALPCPGRRSRSDVSCSVLDDRHPMGTPVLPWA